MREFSLQKKPDIVVAARFIKAGNDLPLHGQDIVVRLYDKDIPNDDFLGQASPDAEGRIEIPFSHDAFVNDLVFKEAKPDFYFVILINNQPVHTTQIMQDITLEDIQRFRMGKGEVVDLGTFLVPEM
jgi:hypothetical protein